MPLPDQLFQKRMTDGSGSSASYESFAPELQTESKRRLAGASIIYAGAWTVSFGIGWMRAIAAGAPSRMPHLADWVKFGVALAIAAGFVLLSRSKRFRGGSFIALAIAFEVVAGLGINADFWNWQRMYDEILQAYTRAGLDWSRMDIPGASPISLMGVPWTAVWLLVFPLVVPLPLRYAVIGSIATAATIPGLLLVSQLVGGTPESVRPHVMGFYADLVLPTLVTVGMAVYACHVIYRLNRDLSRAKRVGSYELIEKIGQGGMGEVWKARHRMLVRPAAIKLIRPDRSGKDDAERPRTALRRFEREAQATSALSSPHTIEIYDFGISQEGVFYYVMEFLSGLDLRTLVERFGPQPADRTIHILRGVCHSLADAHAGGLVHRDVKPANIFVSRRGLDYDFVKVLDFGLVKEAGRKSSVQLTQEGSTTGTPAFMAPEAAIDSQNIDHRADLYALGAVGYWLLTGELVFNGPNAVAIFLQAARETPVPPSRRTEIDVPEELDHLILSCLAKDPADRPQSARELSRRLSEIEARIGAWTSEKAEKWWQLHLPAGRMEPERLPAERLTRLTLEI